jgi:hypothetical protein
MFPCVNHVKHHPLDEIPPLSSKSQFNVSYSTSVSESDEGESFNSFYPQFVSSLLQLPNSYAVNKPIHSTSRQDVPCKTHTPLRSLLPSSEPDSNDSDLSDLPSISSLCQSQTSTKFNLFQCTHWLNLNQNTLYQVKNHPHFTNPLHQVVHHHFHPSYQVKYLSDHQLLLPPHLLHRACQTPQH